MSLGKTSKQEQSQQIDPMLRDEAISTSNLVRALAGLGFNPYKGNTIAAIQPAQRKAMNMANSFAEAFGFDGAAGKGIPKATKDDAGLKGYSTFKGMKKAMGKDYNKFKDRLDAWFEQASQPVDYQEEHTTSGGKK